MPLSDWLLRPSCFHENTKLGCEEFVCAEPWREPAASMRSLPALLTALTALTAYYVYTPLPSTLAEPWKLMLLDATFRCAQDLVSTMASCDWQDPLVICLCAPIIDGSLMSRGRSVYCLQAAAVSSMSRQRPPCPGWPLHIPAVT